MSDLGRSRLRLLALSFVLGLGLVYVTIHRPTLGEIAYLREQEAALQDIVATKRGRVASLAALRAEVSAIEARLLPLWRRLAPKTVETLGPDLAAALAAERVTVDRLRPGDPWVSRGFYAELPVDLALRGDYARLVNALLAMQTMTTGPVPRALDLRAAPSPRSGLLLEADLRVHRTRDPEDDASPAPDGPPRPAMRAATTPDGTVTPRAVPPAACDPFDAAHLRREMPCAGP